MTFLSTWSDRRVRGDIRPLGPAGGVVDAADVPRIPKAPIVLDRPPSWATGDWTVADAGPQESVLTQSFASSRLVIGTKDIDIAIDSRDPNAGREDAPSCRSVQPRRLDDPLRLSLFNVFCGGNVTGAPYPSAGALYPCHPFVIEPLPNSTSEGELAYVDGASRTIRTVTRIDGADLRRVLFEEWAWPTGCLVLLVVDFSRIMARYGDRGLRFGLIEAGLLMSKVLRRSNALGLCACALGGFDDIALVQLLRLDPRCFGLTVGISIGYHKREVAQSALVSGDE